MAAVGLVGFQAWLGRETVRLGNTGESVTAHLAAAMALVGLLVYVLVRSLYPARIGGRGASQRFTLLAAFGAVATFALLLFGSNVTAANAWNVFPDWPLMGGSPFPALVGEQVVAHALHRWVAVLVGVVVVVIAVVAWRTQRRHPRLVALAVAAALLYPIQSVIGGLQILTGLSEWTQTLHLALGDADLGAARRLGRRRLLRGSRGDSRRWRAGRWRQSRVGDRRRLARTPHQERLRPRLHRPDEAADHRAPARHDDPGDGPCPARGSPRLG